MLKRDDWELGFGTEILGVGEIKLLRLVAVLKMEPTKVDLEAMPIAAISLPQLHLQIPKSR